MINQSVIIFLREEHFNSILDVPGYYMDIKNNKKG